MEDLELKPIENRKVLLYLIKNGNNELLDYEKENVKELINSDNFNFITIDGEDADLADETQNLISIIFKKSMMPYFCIDIPDYAKGYLLEEIDRSKEQLEELENEYKTMGPKDSFKGQNLKSWIDYLKDEVKEKEREFTHKIRPQWIAKRILDVARMFEDKSIKIMHFSPNGTVHELKNLLKELEVDVIVYDINKKMLKPQQIIR